jgi:hypothetical protein
MDKITVHFTKRPKNLISWLIRWALPRSRFAIGRASHCVIMDGQEAIEAAMLYGVHSGPAADILVGQEIVETREFNVPSAAAGLAWLRGQVGKGYDYKGAFGLALEPDRDWRAPQAWYCFELAAATLVEAGRDIFADRGHITDATLLAIKP